jgi:N-acetylmuramoyl-L-alanine amidase
LKGLRVMLNPGHGLTLTDEGDWGFQRPLADGHRVFVLEDDSNLRMARTVRDALVAAGAVVDATRELEENVNGASGHPVWREAAIHSLERAGAPRGVWKSHGEGLRGDCRAGQDVRARAYFANLKGADVMLSLHSNAGWPWVRGTQVISSARPYLSAPTDTAERGACMARAFAREVPDAIRRERPDLRWPNAELVSSDRYGENGYAIMPSVILELGFHTNPVDGAALGQESFRRAVAHGITRGLKSFLENPDC